ncbi:MAG: D-glycero-beta-D-manno-heptose 1-phosphate adenylyltransferase [Bacteroidetes bacterium]|nr:MAG: D-glycero-beta-D-manno-heptose 1-phosphate adenylyltransferase [Bacteroidota bacterium]
MKQVEDFTRKIITTNEKLNSLLEKWSDQHDKIVFTNGCFDILHKGHVDYLKRAAELGTKLMIGVNSDASVSAIKGPKRPVQDEDSRMYLLAALEFVNAVVLFNDPTPINLIRKVRPDVLVKGADYKPEEIAGYHDVLSWGGEVLTLEFLDGYSTSKVIKRIIEGENESK